MKGVSEALTSKKPSRLNGDTEPADVLVIFAIMIILMDYSVVIPANLVLYFGFKTLSVCN